MCQVNSPLPPSSASSQRTREEWSHRSPLSSSRFLRNTEYMPQMHPRHADALPQCCKQVKVVVTTITNMHVYVYKSPGPFIQVEREKFLHVVALNFHFVVLHPLIQGPTLISIRRNRSWPCKKRFIVKKNIYMYA